MSDDMPPFDRLWGAPNTFPTTLMGGLRLLADLAEASDAADRRPEIGAMAILTAVATVEAFTNCCFRLVAEETDNPALRKLTSRREGTGLAKRLPLCVETAWGGTLELASDDWMAFEDLLQRRHAIVHFRSGHETVDASVSPEIGNVAIAGLASMDAVIGVSRHTPRDLMGLVARVVRMVAAARGGDEGAQRRMVERWLGVTA